MAASIPDPLDDRLIPAPDAVAVCFPEGPERQPFKERAIATTAMLDGTGMFGPHCLTMFMVSYRADDLSPLSAWLTHRKEQGLPMIRGYSIRSAGETVDDVKSLLQVAGGVLHSLELGSLLNRRPVVLLTLDNLLSDLDWSACPNLIDLHLEVSIPLHRRRRVVLKHLQPMEITSEIEISEAPYSPKQYARKAIALETLHLVLHNDSDPSAMIPAGRLPHVPFFARTLVQLGGLHCQYTVSFSEWIQPQVARYAAQWYNTMLNDELEMLRDVARGEPGWRWNQKSTVPDDPVKESLTSAAATDTAE